MDYQHPTGKTPKRVALIGAGPTMVEWPTLMAATAVAGPKIDEVWGINAVGRGIGCDLSFIMDDYAATRGHSPNLADWFEACPHPIITSVPRPNCPTARAFPLAEALSLPNARDFLNHTAAYAVVYALLIGVKELLIFGCDYISASAPYQANGPDRPARYLGCISYWAGYAAARGMDVVVCPRSPLLDADLHPNQRFYGYLIKPTIRRSETAVDSEADSEAA
jgi:hypothetical protein